MGTYWVSSAPSAYGNFTAEEADLIATFIAYQLEEYAKQHGYQVEVRVAADAQQHSADAAVVSALDAQREAHWLDWAQTAVG